MPELSRFFGIVITMYFLDHGAPHIHAYGGNRRHPDWMIRIRVSDGAVLDDDDRCPSVARRLVKEWVAHRRPELEEAWRAMGANRPPGKIAPLKVK